ncbi:hypothetical protein M9Y10_039946 [Tritrichomonas musculus]|uniref:Uncharacterized protein n=1 Tax=Tritrichomonas musculus TaxID=1915356 RepID=A0ABR2GR96_9EUKA
MDIDGVSLLHELCVRIRAGGSSFIADFGPFRDIYTESNGITKYVLFPAVRPVIKFHITSQLSHISTFEDIRTGQAPLESFGAFLGQKLAALTRFISSFSKSWSLSPISDSPRRDLHSHCAARWPELLPRAAPRVCAARLIHCRRRRAGPRGRPVCKQRAEGIAARVVRNVPREGERALVRVRQDRGLPSVLRCDGQVRHAALLLQPQRPVRREGQGRRVCVRREGEARAELVRCRLRLRPSHKGHHGPLQQHRRRLVCRAPRILLDRLRRDQRRARGRKQDRRSARRHHKGQGAAVAFRGLRAGSVAPQHGGARARHKGKRVAPKGEDCSQRGRPLVRPVV